MLFPFEDYFSYSQYPLVAYRFLCRNEALLAFPGQLWHVYWCHPDLGPTLATYPWDFMGVASDIDRWQSLIANPLTLTLFSPPPPQYSISFRYRSRFIHWANSAVWLVMVFRNSYASFQRWEATNNLTPLWHLWTQQQPVWHKKPKGMVVTCTH